MSGVCANCGDVLYCAECHEPKQVPSLSAGVGLLSDSEFILDMQTYKLDHEPDGWPAVQQWKIDRLIDIIFKTRRGMVYSLVAEISELRAFIDKLRSVKSEPDKLLCLLERHK